MGCTVREKQVKNIRKSRSIKPTNPDMRNHIQTIVNDKLSKSMVESGFKPSSYDMGFSDSSGFKPDNSTPNPSSGGFDDCGWGYCTEEQLEEILLKQLEFLYNEAVSKLVGLGFDEEVALQAVLRNGDFYGGMDVLSNILHNSLGYLKSGVCGNEGDCELVFSDLRQLEEYSLAGMVCLLQRVRPCLSRGDAMWCLLMSDLHVGRASSIEIPMVPAPGDVTTNVESVDSEPSSPGISVPVSGFGEFFPCSEASIQREIDCVNRFNLSSSMRPLLKKDVAASAAFRFKQQMQMHSKGCASSAVGGDSMKGAPAAVDVPSEPYVESNDCSQDILNTLLDKFRDLNLDENLECVTEDQKDEIIMTLLHQVKDMEKQVNERREWAQKKAMQAAVKLGNDLTELRILRTEREETQRLMKGKQTVEDTTMKMLTEIENALRKACSQVDRANAAVRKLEIENAEIRAEMEASKLSASESVTICLEVTKREKKYLKKLLAWEKQKTKLQEEISGEKQKIADMQQLLQQIHADQKDIEVKWKRELKEKELAMTQMEEEKCLKEATGSSNKRKLEALRLRIDIDFQRYQDDLQRLEQEFTRLKASSTLVEPQDLSNTLATRSPEAVRNQGETIARLLQDLDDPGKEEGCERECLICMKEEVSVVFLPCAHQVMCASCGEDYGKKGKATCPCCRCLIEQSIRVFGASS